jgi:hypothetical protein
MEKDCCSKGLVADISQWNHETWHRTAVSLSSPVVTAGMSYNKFPLFLSLHLMTVLSDKK